jgi:hypothetical protein
MRSLMTGGMLLKAVESAVKLYTQVHIITSKPDEIHNFVNLLKYGTLVNLVIEHPVSVKHSVDGNFEYPIMIASADKISQPAGAISGEAISAIIAVVGSYRIITIELIKLVWDED